MRAVALLVAAAAVAGGAHAVAAKPRASRLSVARFCSGAYQDERGECRVDQRRRLPLYPEVRCSVDVDAPRPTRFTARIFYRGELERGYALVLHGRHTRAIAVAFSGLGGPGRDYGVPGGRYSCEFTLGSARVAIGGTSDGPRRTVRAPAACAVYGTASRVCQLPQPEFLSAPRSISCSVVLVGMVGTSATTQLQRLEGATWKTLYSARDALRVPIAEVWAYTSARGGGSFPTGDYRCRFLAAGGAVLADHDFLVRS